MQIFLSILGWALLTILFLLVAVLFTPIGVSVKIDYDKLVVKLKILFFSFQLYPQKEKSKKQIKKEAALRRKQEKEQAKGNGEQKNAQEHSGGKEQEGEQEEKPKKPKNKAFSKLDAEKIIEIIKASASAIKIVFKGVFITKIEIIYPVYKEDSADNAIAYGQAQAYFGGIAATLQNFLNLSFKRVQIIPDFNNEYKYKRYFYCNIWATTFIMIIAAVYLLIAMRREKII